MMCHRLCGFDKIGTKEAVGSNEEQEENGAAQSLFDDLFASDDEDDEEVQAKDDLNEVDFTENDSDSDATDSE